MDLQPIVVAKPARGREMRSNFIPKEIMDTMRVVSAKTVKGDIAVDSLQKGREGEVEIYHEGYIDGKLYLVPDSNLQAMRDIVNLKMRRRNNSNTKPQTSLDEPSQYSEFTSKLDTLLDKIDELAESSNDNISYENRNVEEPYDGKTDEEKETNDITDPADHQSNKDQTNKQRQKSVSEKSQKPTHSTRERDLKNDDDKGTAIVKGKDKVALNKILKEYDPDNELNEHQTSTDSTYHLMTDNTDQLIADHKVIPPILDENIKYKRVKPKDASKRSYTEHSTNLVFNPAIKPENKATMEKNVSDINEENSLLKDSFNSINPLSSNGKQKQDMVGKNCIIYRDTNTDIFRLLISGHLKCGMTPLFIIHHNYSEENILENQVPDFKSHKKDGNIDIFISGKFFTDNILIEDSEGSPEILSIKPYKIFLDDNSTVHKHKFKDVYNVGPVDIALEGEFIRNAVTSNYTPVFSMEIMKHGSSEDGQTNQTPVTLLYSKQSHTTLFDDQAGSSNLTDGQITEKHKHVHYAKSNEETAFEENNTDNESKKIKGLFKKIQKTKLYRKLFVQNKHNLKEDSKSSNALLANSLNVRLQQQRHVKKRTALRRKSTFKERKTKQRIMTRNKRAKDEDPNTSGLHSSVAVYQVNPDVMSAVKSGKAANGEQVSITGDGSKAKNIYLGRKKKKGDKNQAIVENPILAQMQEFFIT